MRTGLFIALILFIMVSFFPRQLLGLFTTDQTIIEAGMSYLTIIRFTYFFFAITQILLEHFGVWRSQGLHLPCL